MNIIQIHVALIKYIIKEFKKKTTIKQHLLFIGKVIHQYFLLWLQKIRNVLNLFNKEYREQRKKYKKYNEVKKDLQKALKILQYIDNKMAKAGLNRQRRRQFWRDFYKSGQVRKEMFDDLLKEMK